eukprot:2538681-Pyramimonas_sp.AAC.1
MLQVSLRFPRAAYDVLLRGLERPPPGKQSAFISRGCGPMRPSIRTHMGPSGRHPGLLGPSGARGHLGASRGCYRIQVVDRIDIEWSVVARWPPIEAMLLHYR